ncbi:hypothetical protein E3P99_03453 [Wallemia hederae]|uniref:Leo1-like protein n=1 Tax=Wallemia hederae TaxID=1540922 RepID=A0A4T0FFT0_9BASI|nr:hypothetical protein E3P99_03453 [Wallemia hederae]
MSDNEELMDDLFGGADNSMEDVDNASQNGKEGSEINDANDNDSDGDSQRRAMEYNEEDMPTDGVILEQVRTATMDINNLPPIRSSEKNWLAKIPNFLNIQSAGFDRESFGEDDKSLAQNANSANTIRWRWHQDQSGQTIAQSNSRVIRWSDGSLSLQVGKEMYDMNLNEDDKTATSSEQSNPRQYAYLHHEKNEIVMGDSVIHGQLNFVPPSLASSVHKKYASTVNDKHFKAAKMKMVDKETESKDPEKELLKKMEDDKKQARQRAKTERAAARKELAASGGNLDWSSDDDDISRTAASRRIGARGAYEKEPDDGFVVDDDGDEEGVEGMDEDEEEEEDGQGSADSLDDADERIEQKKVYKKRVESDEDE